MVLEVMQSSDARTLRAHLGAWGSLPRVVGPGGEISMGIRCPITFLGSKSLFSVAVWE
jgi:hypothetical protein